MPGWNVDVKDNGIALSGGIPAGGSARCFVYIPRWDAKPEDHESLTGGDDLLRETKAYWERLLAPAMGISVPEPLINDVFKANQAHMMLAARNELDGNLVVPWCAAMTYGPLDTDKISGPSASTINLPTIRTG